MKSLLISIITISLNAEKHIEQTIQSVLNQTYKNFEYIVVDGGSTDRTVEIISKHQNQIDHFLSEIDEGIADAMNKGIGLASGDFVLFLHADDYFKDDHSLENALEYFKETADIIACHIQFGKQFTTYKPRGFGFWTYFKQGIYHQGSFCRKSLLEGLNGFDKHFKIAMDYDFFLRAYLCKANLIIAPVVLTVMRDTGISSRQDWISLKKRFDEERSVHKKNCPSVLMSIAYNLYWSLYLPYRFLIHTLKLNKESFQNRYHD